MYLIEVFWGRKNQPLPGMNSLTGLLGILFLLFAGLLRASAVHPIALLALKNASVPKLLFSFLSPLFYLH